MIREKSKAYVTKFALTKGIMHLDGEIETSGGGPASFRANGDYVSFYRNDWHKTLEAAVVQAEKMRKTKLESLRKQIVKLESMEF